MLLYNWVDLQITACAHYYYRQQLSNN